jgi:hypothetical protein
MVRKFSLLSVDDWLRQTGEQAQVEMKDINQGQSKGVDDIGERGRPTRRTRLRIVETMGFLHSQNTHS